jgi:hypothetical protein
MMGTNQHYYIKNDFYRSVTDGTYSEWQLYNPLENRIYNKLTISDTLYWWDGNNNSEKIQSFKIVKDSIEVLGYSCDVFILKTKIGTTSYFYNEELRVDPELFKDHKFENWNFIISKTRSLPLKLIVENEQFKSISIATKIIPKKLDKALFELPNAPVIKSPF